MIVVSKCLAGEPCRYDGGDNLAPEIRALVERGEAIAGNGIFAQMLLDAGIPVVTEEEYRGI